MPRSDSKGASPRRQSSSRKTGSGARPSGASGARSRARERALRKSGEVGIARNTLILGFLGIFAVGVIAGGTGGLYLQRAGLLPPAPGSGNLVAEPSQPQAEPAAAVAATAENATDPAETPEEAVAAVEVEPGRDAAPDPEAEAETVAALAPAAGTAEDQGPPTSAEPADLPPTGHLPELAGSLESTPVATIEAEVPAAEAEASADEAVPPASESEPRATEQVAALPSASMTDATEVAEPDRIAEAILAFDPEAADGAEGEAADPEAEPDDVADQEPEVSGTDDVATVDGPPADAAANDAAVVAPEAPDAPALTEVAALTFPPLPRARDAERPVPAPGEPLLVYEEPVRLSDLLPPPSDAELDAFVQEAGLVAKPPQPASPALAWQRHAVQVSGIGNRPMIALVIDDLGLNRPNARKVVDLPAPLTLAFMTYAEGIGGILEQAREAGHELLVHMPMEPSDPRYDPGPNVLRSGMKAEELKRRLDWGLRRFDGYVGINNHMGSKFTTSMEGMAVVMETLQKRGLLYLDSVTAGGSVGAGLAERTGVPFAVRDVFIDNDHDNPQAIRRQLAEAERIALRRGYAVAIGHPHGATIEVLRDWLAGLEARGFALVPISAVVERRIEIAGGNGDAG